MLGEAISADACCAISVTRAGRAILPSTNMVLETGDTVHVSATLEGVEALRAKMGLVKK